jgi:hypothetical protein
VSLRRQIAVMRLAHIPMATAASCWADTQGAGCSQMAAFGKIPPQSRLHDRGQWGPCLLRLERSTAAARSSDMVIVARQAGPTRPFNASRDAGQKRRSKKMTEQNQIRETENQSAGPQGLTGGASVSRRTERNGRKPTLGRRLWLSCSGQE